MSLILVRINNTEVKALGQDKQKEKAIKIIKTMTVNNE